MTIWLAGMRITADRLNDHEAEDTTTTGLVAGTDFSVSSFSGKKVGGLTQIVVLCSRTGSALTESSAGSGNLSPEPLMATLPSGWRPPETIPTLFSNGAADGEAIINTAGEITLRTISGSSGIGTSTTVRLTHTWISENS